MNDEMIKSIDALTHKTVAPYGLAPQDVEDAIQVARVSALDALATYEGEHNAEPLTWCSRVAEFRLKDWLRERQYTVVPLPERLAREWQKVTIVRTKLEQALGRTPRGREVVEAFNEKWPDDTITLDQYETMRSKAEYDQVYLSDMETEDDNSESIGYEEMLPGSPWEEPDYIVEVAEQRDVATVMDRVHEQLALMNQTEADVIRRYFGLGCPEQTLRQIEQETDVSRMTVSRTLSRGLENLRGRLTLMGVDFEGIRLS